MSISCIHASLRVLHHDDSWDTKEKGKKEEIHLLLHLANVLISYAFHLLIHSLRQSLECIKTSTTPQNRDEVQTIRQIHLFSYKPPNILRKEEQWMILLLLWHSQHSDTHTHTEKREGTKCNLSTISLNRNALCISCTQVFCIDGCSSTKNVFILFPYFAWCCKTSHNMYRVVRLACICIYTVTFIKCLVIDFLTISCVCVSAFLTYVSFLNASSFCKFF